MPQRTPEMHDGLTSRLQRIQSLTNELLEAQRVPRNSSGARKLAVSIRKEIAAAIADLKSRA